MQPRASKTRYLVRRASLEEVLPLRWRVLRPGLPPETAAFQGDDAQHTEHWLAQDTETGAVVSVASIYQVGLPAGQGSIVTNPSACWQLRGMASSPDSQGQGAGGALLEGILLSLQGRWGRPVFWCNARQRAVPFYARHGFETTSDPFDIPGVGPHRVMQRAV